MNENKSIFREIFQAIWVFIKTIVVFIYRLIYSIRFIFSIPLLTFAAGVFTFCFVLFIKPVINFLPESLNVGFIETFIGAIIFIVLKFMLFNDKLKHDYNFKPYQALLTFACTVILWLIPIIFFVRDAEYAGIFLSESKVYTFPALLYVILYLPHMWLATITQEFVYSVGVGLVINSVIFIIIAVCFTKWAYKEYDE